MENPFTGETWSIAPTAQSPNLPDWNNDYTDIFDWMFSQNKAGVPAEDGPTAMYGTPELGSNDPLWDKTMEYPINKSTVPDDPRPHATGTVKILWDDDYVYARVVVEDSNLYQGPGARSYRSTAWSFCRPGIQRLQPMACQRDGRIFRAVRIRTELHGLRSRTQDISWR